MKVNRFNTTIFLVLCVILASCSYPKFYKEIVSTYPKEKKEGVLVMKLRDNDKLVFDRLNKQLRNTNHIIYHYVPYPALYSSQFSALLYDVDNKKYFYLESRDDDRINIKVSTFLTDDDYHKFVLDNYLDENLSYLLKLGEISNHSGVQTNEVIYDINLKTESYKRFEFKSFLFMNGKPTHDID